MKVSRAQAEENRKRIVEAAGRLFRERGIDGIGVAGLMKAAGLTHGGFYGHFKSKEDLAAQACAGALAENRRRWQGVIDKARQDPLSALIDFYVSEAHRDAPGKGCALATLGIDAARHDRSVRAAFTGGIRGYLDLLLAMAPGRSKAAKRRKALATLSGMVGAIVLARAVEDDALSAEILAATAAELKASAPSAPSVDAAGTSNGSLN